MAHLPLRRLRTRSGRSRCPAPTPTGFAPILARLEAKGITLAGFELGNEINLSGTNPEFDAPHNRARQLGPADLERDPEGKRVAAGLRQYLTVLAALKDMRDRSKLNRNTPILTAGLGTYDQDDGPLPSWAKADVVSVHTTLGYLRAHGLDRLVEAYAVHIYPDTKHDGADAPAARKQRIAAYDLADCRPPGSPGGKPCWITEWGIDNPSLACPPDDGRRARLLREIMADFRPYVRKGAVAGLLYFAWNTTPQSSALLASSLWRYGALTEAGRLAIDATVLR